MGAELTHISHAREAVQRQEKRADRAETKLEHAGHAATRTAAASLTGFGLGVMQTRLDGDKQSVLGIPAPLIIGGIGHLAAIWLDGWTNTLAHAVGDGGMTTYFVGQGRAVGRDLRARKGLPPVTLQGETGGGNLSDDDLLALARRRG